MRTTPNDTHFVTLSSGNKWQIALHRMEDLQIVAKFAEFQGQEDVMRTTMDVRKVEPDVCLIVAAKGVSKNENWIKKAVEVTEMLFKLLNGP